ncbi:MAG: metallophosphoesterase [Bryobacteraceae bacterium]|nr:metallophosphoesterase [Bryobacteraceae bacterium]
MSSLLEIGPGRWAHASGALWLPDPRTLLIADAHLGYGWAQRRRGELGPVADKDIAARLTHLLDELQPRELVFLGDVVHAPYPSAEERRLIVDVFTRMAARANLVLVRGNHDRGLTRDFGYPLVTEWRAPGLLAAHGDRLPPVNDEHLVLGHFHPVLTPRDAAGARRRLPVFTWTEHTTILPAFSPFAAGADLHKHFTAELAIALGSGQVCIAACTGQRVARLPFRRPGVK